MAEQQEELGGNQTAKLDRLIEDLRDIASSQPTSPFSSPVSLKFYLKANIYEGKENKNMSEFHWNFSCSKVCPPTEHARPRPNSPAATNGIAAVNGRASPDADGTFVHTGGAR